MNQTTLNPSRRQLVGIFAMLLLPIPCFAGGPKEAAKLTEFKTFATTGDHAGKEIDFTDKFKSGWTVYVFVQADRFDRPLARFLRGLDQELVKNDRRDVQVVAVWLTDDKEKSKEHQPKINQSLQFGQTTLTVFLGDKAGPNGWEIDNLKTATAVVTQDRVVRKCLDWESVNDTVVPDVFSQIKK